MTVPRFATRTPPIPVTVDTFEMRRSNASPKSKIEGFGIEGFRVLDLGFTGFGFRIEGSGLKGLNLGVTV